MTGMKKPLLNVLLAVGIVATAAVIQGRLTNRWGMSQALTSSGTDLQKQMPNTIGDWDYQEDLPLSQAVQDVLQCVSHLNHVFVNRNSGENIGATLIIGPSGPLTVHTPEICLSTGGYVQVGRSQQVEIKHEERVLGTFYRANFRSQTPNLPSLEIFWGWHDGKGWSAPDNPRLTFGGAPALYKLQVTAQLWPNVAEGDEGSVAQFLRTYLLAVPPFRLETSDSATP